MKFQYYKTKGTEPHYDERDIKILLSECGKLAREANLDHFIFTKLSAGEVIQVKNGWIIWQEEK